MEFLKKGLDKVSQVELEKQATKNETGFANISLHNEIAARISSKKFLNLNKEALIVMKILILFAKNVKNFLI